VSLLTAPADSPIDQVRQKMKIDIFLRNRDIPD